MAGYSQTCMHLMYVALHEVTWCMVVWCTQNLHWDGCSFMWLKSTTVASAVTSVSIPLQWIFKKHTIKKLVTHVEPHASTVNLLKRGENSDIYIYIYIYIYKRSSIQKTNLPFLFLLHRGSTPQAKLFKPEKLNKRKQYSLCPSLV